MPDTPNPDRDLNSDISPTQPPAPLSEPTPDVASAETDTTAVAHTTNELDVLSTTASPVVTGKNLPNWPLRWLWIFILTLVGFYVFALPEIQIAWWNYRYPNRMLPSFLQLDIVTRSVLRLLETFVVAFFFAVGSSFGSFLNVVAYRLPNNLDISVAGSRCPNCNKRLTFQENMPLFGWVSLRGKCSGCQIPIPFKYLAAELLVGFLAVWLGVHELLSGGINLPLRAPNFYAGVVWIIFYTKWDLVSYALFHFALFCILATQVLTLDNQLAVPKRFFVFCCSVGMALSLCFPWLILVHASLFLPGIEMREPGQLEGVRLEWQQSTQISVLMGDLYSLAIALPAAIGASLLSRHDRQFHFSMWLGTFLCLGIWLGWQASLCIATASLLTSVPLVAFQLPPYRKALYMSCIVLGVTVLHHGLWAVLVNALLNQLSANAMPLQ